MIVKQVKPWTIQLSAYKKGGDKYGRGGTYYTCLTTRYVTRDGFQFEIYSEGMFSALGKLLGMQDIQAGYPEFDRDYIVKANDEGKFKALLGNPRIRELVRLRAIHLQARRRKGGRPEGVNELRLDTKDLIDDTLRLNLLFELVEETLNQLCEIGSASRVDPSTWRSVRA
jgi:hypothetical protein